MRDLDVRDLEGRLGRFVASLTIGASAAVLIATMLPQFRRLRGAAEFSVPALILVGAIAFTFGIYAVLHALANRPPRIDLPRAKLRPRAARRKR